MYSSSTCVMFTNFWKNLGSPKFVPSTITFHAYDGHPSKPKVLYQNVHNEVIVKTILINVEVVDVVLDYNIILGCSFMYAIKMVFSSGFQVMLFPQNENIITLDHLTFYDPKPQSNPDNFLPTLMGN